MKGYSEERGKVFKLDYDAESKQFVSKPVAHGFQPDPVGVAQKPVSKRKRAVIEKACREVSTWQPDEPAALHQV